MALTIYPDTNYDSFISLVDANTFLSENSLQYSQWDALDDSTKEIYLRISFGRILGIIDLELIVEQSDIDNLAKANSLMAIHDLVYSISSSINPNVGAIVKEKVGDLEVEYSQKSGAKGISRSPFPSSAKTILSKYCEQLSLGSIKTLKIERS